MVEMYKVENFKLWKLMVLLDLVDLEGGIAHDYIEPKYVNSLDQVEDFMEFVGIQHLVL
jgi:hypothetical protein